MRTTLKHYRILEKLGAGGMGEVYLAEDATLGRKIALKVLPPELAASPERLQRFESEARAVAALNHPNIVTVYSVEESDGIRFITMELVRGKTLTNAVRRPALREFLDVAVPLADALAAAHQHGIVHRDLKPDNLMVTEEGRVKILDFGLAKIRVQPGSDSEPFASHLPTKSVTSPGVIVGTVAYMSPEQAEGKGVDHRSDIFSLGIIFYQLLSGRHPFSGDTAASVLSGILKDTPPLVSDLDPQVPYELARIVRRCLEKGLAKRYQSAVDLRNDLEEVKADSDSGALQKRSIVASPSRAIPRFVPWALAALLGVLAALLVFSGRSDVPPIPERRFAISPPAGTTLYWSVVLSKDGSRLVFNALRQERRSLYLQSLDQLTARELEGTENALEPFLSPDGEWVGFTSEGKLKKAPVSGGGAVTLCDTGDNIGSDWGEDGSIIFGTIKLGLRRVSSEGGEPEWILKADGEKGELDFHYPDILPGGEEILVTRHDKNGAFGIELYDFESGERKRVLEDAFQGLLAPTGHLVYGRGHSLFAAPFDRRRGEVSGPSVLVVENVNGSPKDGVLSFGVGEDGTLVYIPRRSPTGRSLVWVDRNGNEEPLGISPRAFENPRLSPDGKQLAVAVEENDRRDIWVYDLERGAEHRVTFEGVNESPVWTPDGAKITYASGTGNFRNLYWKSADGAGVAERLTESELRQWPYDWSPDGKSLAFMETDPSDYHSLGILQLDGGKTVPFTPAEGTGRDSLSNRQNKPRFSPDGRWIAYNWNLNVYIQPYPGPGGPRQISTERGVEPVWAPDGREIYYSIPGLDSLTMVAVSIETSPSVRSGRPQKLFEHRYAGTLYGPSHDLARNGRFLMIQRSEEEITPLRMHLVQGWFEELKRRVPTTGSAR